MKKTLIFQGAEAKVYLVSKPKRKAEQVGTDIRATKSPKAKSKNTIEQSSTILKERIQKSYRHPALDEQLRKSRTKHETKILQKAYDLKINVPKVLSSDKFNLELEFIEGEKLSDTLNSYEEKKAEEIMKKVGKQIALLHTNNIIHGDLTTSNIILKKSSRANLISLRRAGSTRKSGPRERETSELIEVFIIDFGLGYISTKEEDKAVDLHILKQALEAKHWENHEKLFKSFLKGYKPKELEKIIERLKRVEKRGRYKH